MSPVATRITRSDECFTSWYIYYITWQIMFNVYSSGIFGIQWLKSDHPIIFVTSVLVTSCRATPELSPLQKIQTSFVKTHTRQRTCKPLVRSCILLTIISRSRWRKDTLSASSDKFPLTITWYFPFWVCRYEQSLESNFFVMLHPLLFSSSAVQFPRRLFIFW